MKVRLLISTFFVLTSLAYSTSTIAMDQVEKTTKPDLEKQEGIEKALKGIRLEHHSIRCLMIKFGFMFEMLDEAISAFIEIKGLAELNSVRVDAEGRVMTYRTEMEMHKEQIEQWLTKNKKSSEGVLDLCRERAANAPAKRTAAGTLNIAKYEEWFAGLCQSSIQPFCVNVIVENVLQSIDEAFVDYCTKYWVEISDFTKKDYTLNAIEMARNNYIHVQLYKHAKNVKSAVEFIKDRMELSRALIRLKDRGKDSEGYGETETSDFVKLMEKIEEFTEKYPIYSEDSAQQKSLQKVRSKIPANPKSLKLIQAKNDDTRWDKILDNFPGKPVGDYRAQLRVEEEGSFSSSCSESSQLDSSGGTSSRSSSQRQRMSVRLRSFSEKKLPYFGKAPAERPKVTIRERQVPPRDIKESDKPKPELDTEGSRQNSTLDDAKATASTAQDTVRIKQRHKKQSSQGSANEVVQHPQETIAKPQEIASPPANSPRERPSKTRRPSKNAESIKLEPGRMNNSHTRSNSNEVPVDTLKAKKEKPLSREKSSDRGKRRSGKFETSTKNVNSLARIVSSDNVDPTLPKASDDKKTDKKNK